MPRRLLILLLLSALAAPAFARRGQTPPRVEALVTHGTGDGQFLAVIERQRKSDGSYLPVSTVRYRAMGGGPEAWADYAKFDARVLALAERGGDLAVLLEVAQSGPGRTQLRYIHNSLDRGSRAVDVGGTALPRGVTPVDIAGGSAGSRLLALGRRDGVAGIWALAGTQWEALGALPEAVAALPDDALELGVAGRRAIVAGRTDPQALLVLMQAEEGWEVLGEVSVAENEHFQVISATGDALPLLYMFGEADRVVQFHRPGDDGEAEMHVMNIDFAPPPALEVRLDAADPRAGGLAIGSIRLLRSTTAETKSDAGGPVLLERALDPATLEPVAEESVVLRFASLGAEVREQMITLLLYSLLVVAVVAVLRQRPVPPADRLRDVAQQLAPLNVRFAAGAIDGIPIVLTAAAWWMFEERLGSVGQWIVVLAGSTVYLGHVMVAEAATGRSLGKRLFRLKVVRTDGGEAGPGAILLRNVLRPLDVPTLGLGLAWLNPLRQRLGDIAAGTTVIRTPARTEP